ncbi:solute carrier organic anion transporter family member 1B3-like [Elgaria multicarinata webbii]|uniref:solute carrier organic anion transporter family member 1B3-like n=1 Tax=Elgaria multicarinata webbii TaxID=159646 RepID=UPI002FCD1B64
MEPVDTDVENMNGLVMEMEPETQSLKDQTDLELTTKTKTKCCKGLKTFIAALAFTYFSKVFSGAIMKSSITQIERRFGISSSRVGVMDGGFELGNLLMIAFVSYFGAKFHRPRIIALGCFIMSFGSFLTAMPHFFMGYYKYDTLSRSPDNSTSSISPCSLNQTVPGVEELPGSGCEKESISYTWIFVLMGNLLRGIGETPITPLGISYIDDFSREEDAPLYIGCLHTIAMIGPMAGYLLGALLARLYVDIGFVDLSTVTITPSDARWVGAWWLGFLVAGVTNLISGIPFLFLPKSLDTNKENDHIKPKMDVVKINGDESHMENSETEQGVGCTGKLKGFFKSMKTLLVNRMYFVLLCVTLLQANSFIGYMTYNPKYMEQQYSQPASKSNFVIGVAVLPAVGISMFLGGFIMKKYKLGIVRATKMAITVSLVGFLISLLYVAVGCDNRTVAGLTVFYDGQPATLDTIPLSSVCNSNCSCAPNQWDPVCGENGITYVSACFAGCKDITGFRKETVFHNCSCIEQAGSVMRNSSAVLGECQRRDDCSKKFIYFIAIKVASSICYAIGTTPSFMVMIRCVHPKLKSLAVGVYMLVIRALAGIPAPAYFGAVIDKSCLMWSKTSCGQRGACRIYDSNVYRKSFFGLVYALRTPAFLLSAVFFYLVKKHFGKREADANENGTKEGIPLNGEVKKNGTAH